MYLGYRVQGPMRTGDAALCVGLREGGGRGDDLVAQVQGQHVAAICAVSGRPGGGRRAVAAPCSRDGVLSYKMIYAILNNNSGDAFIAFEHSCFTMLHKIFNALCQL